VDAQAFGDLRAGAEHRVEAGAGFLENHRHAVATDGPALLDRHLEDVLAVEQNLAGGVGGVARQQLHGREGGDRLAAAGLADHAQRFAGVQVERDAVDRLGHAAAADFKVGAKISDR